MAPKSILVIRRDNIGDLLCTTPLIHSLRTHYPGCKIAVLANSANAAVLERNPDVDEIHIYTKYRDRRTSTLAWLVAQGIFMWKVRRASYELAITAKSMFDPRSVRLARRLGCKSVLGFGPRNDRGEEKPDLLVPPQDWFQHEVQTVSALLSPLGFSGGLGPLRVHPDVKDLEIVQSSFASLSDGPRLAIYLSAREEERRLPLSKWIEVARKATECGWRLAIFWAPRHAVSSQHAGDEKMARELSASVSPESATLVPTATLSRLAAGFQCCDAFVGADGGPLHIAAACELPIVGLFQNDEKKTSHWYPWGVPHQLVIGPELPISSIQTDAIVRALSQLEPRSPSKRLDTEAATTSIYPT